MRIAQLAPLVEPVPPRGYGGTELVVHLLTEELVKRGHDVTLFASGDSRTTARLEAIVPIALRANKEVLIRQWQAFDLRALLRLEQLRGQFDLIHNHMGYQALPYLQAMGAVSLTTNHNPIKPYNEPIYRAYSHLPYVSISMAYRRLNLNGILNYVATVYNGIDVCRYQKVDRSRPGSYLLFLGRFSRAKGPAAAIRIARSLGLPLKMAGKIDEGDVDYYRAEVEPLLSFKDIEYLGEVDEAGKLELLSGAIAVVYPVAFEEPFGLVMAEALAAGVPTMALDRGAVREVLSDGKTAIIGQSEEELVRRFSEIKELTVADCRQRAREFFSKERMAEAYEKVYESLLAGARAT